MNVEQHLLLLKTVQQSYIHLFLHLTMSQPIFVEISFHGSAAIWQSLWFCGEN